MNNLNCMGLGHVAFYVKDMAESKKFYMDILEFEVISEHIENDERRLWMCFLTNETLTIELVTFADPAETANRQDGFVDHLCIRVRDIEAAKAYLESRGVKFELDIFHDKHLYENGGKFAMFRGPNGERLQLEQRL